MGGGEGALGGEGSGEVLGQAADAGVAEHAAAVGKGLAVDAADFVGLEGAEVGSFVGQEGAEGGVDGGIDGGTALVGHLSAGDVGHGHG